MPSFLVYFGWLECTGGPVELFAADSGANKFLQASGAFTGEDVPNNGDSGHEHATS